MAAHDFASKKKTPRAKKTAPKPGKSSNSKTTEAPAKPKKKIPAIIWIVLGISIALGSQYGYRHLKNNPEVSSVIEKANETISKTTEKAIEPIKEMKDEAPRFEFYEILKKNEVTVSVDQTATQPKKKFHYIVQAGSFRNKSDAEQMRSRLILNNLTNASTDTITTKSGTWHRVNVGPFTNRSRLEKARDTLASMDIQGLVKKIPNK